MPTIKKLYPDDHALSLKQVTALLQANQPQKAITILERQVALGAPLTTTYKLLAQAKGNMGNKGQSHRWLAEYYYISGRLEQAADQLRLAENFSKRDEFQLAKISSRLREIEIILAQIEGSNVVTMVNQQRRTVIKNTISAATVALVVSSGLILPKKLLAHWPSDAFTAATVEDALLALVGKADIADDRALNFKVGAPPSYAVNGAAVPIEIQSNLDDIERIAVLVEKNPFPLVMSLDVTSEMKLPFKSMIKIREDSPIIAIIRTNGKLYKTTRFVEVDIGGCG